jgi:hypothetical protein
MTWYEGTSGGTKATHDCPPEQLHHGSHNPSIHSMTAFITINKRGGEEEEQAVGYSRACSLEVKILYAPFFRKNSLL